MKIFIQSPDAQGRIDGTIVNQVLNYLPTVKTQEESDCVVVPISYLPDFKFNDKLFDIQKSIIIMDYLEFGWDWDQEKENILGKGNITNFGMYQSQEWGKLDSWVDHYNPKLQFKRELLQKDKSDTLIPIEFLCYLPKTPIQTEEEFNARPIEVFYNWGWSHPSRVNLHADIFRAMNTHNIGVISNWTQLPQYFEHKSPRTWLSIYSPWYDRQPMKNVMEWQSKSKFSVCMPGAGVKTFRHAECCDTIPVMMEENLSWSYPWNTIVLDPDNVFNDLLNALDTFGLYSMYLSAQVNMDNYRPENYIPKYILPNIERVL